MAEQQGPAAGTAKPDTPSAFDLQIPWSIHTLNPRLIVDADGSFIAVVTAVSMLTTRPLPGVPLSAAEALARHIVACVNFCRDMGTEQLEFLAEVNDAGGKFAEACAATPERFAHPLPGGAL